MSPTKLIAFYLPQFHPIPENDDWWGTGFTEWTNVASAQPRFSGHHQPHIPADLGFYDLRLAETRIAQAELAKKYGIYGFCYYHYWFNGSMLLERPLNEVISSGTPDHPFCLCWANESWTRAWDGLERQVLKKQEYAADDHHKHIDWLIKVFKDTRYIQIDGKPVFAFYRLHNIPDAKGMIELWRKKALEAGLNGLYLCAVRSGFVDGSDQDLLSLGVDSIIDFQPNRDYFPPPKTMTSTLLRTIRKILPDSIYQSLKLSIKANNIVNYRDMVDVVLSKEWPTKYIKFPCVFPSWDNTPRRKSATIIQNETPEHYKRWLLESIIRTKSYPENQQIVFINAWNEWAEGCHLEPDRKNQHQFLHATAQALEISGGL